MQTISSPDKAYGNIGVYSPDNILMFFTNQKRLNFYIKNNLAEQIGEKKFRLTFEPKGLGYASDTSRHLPRENCCVISGEADINKLTRHHIVPSFFRKHFPSEFKYNFQLVVLTERNLHYKYTVEEHKFYNVIADKFNVPHYKEFEREFQKKIDVYKVCNVLRRYIAKLPEDKKLEIQQKFVDATGMEATFDNVELYMEKLRQTESGFFTKKTRTDSQGVSRDSWLISPSGTDLDFGKVIASKITDYKEFEMMWLEHFVQTMKPKYLPFDLVVKYFSQ